MIELTRLNGNLLVVNSDLIQYAEASPDTTLTLVNGEKLVVRESCGEVINRTLACRARILGEAARNFPGGLVVSAAGSALRATAAQQAIKAQEELDVDMEAMVRRRRSEP
jgi:flagellar protein FlbD